MGPKSDFAEWCWDSSLKHNEDWEHVTHDDSNRDNFPLVGQFLDLSPVYAYKSDLMRLEVLYRYGGIYLDTDVEIIRNLKHFSEYTYPFAAWESPDTIGSAVIGSPPGNDQILELIIYCLGSILVESEDGAINYGGHLRMFSPSAITKLWSKNRSVTLLNSESFYPYHWSQMHTRGSDFSKNPATFGVHHWNGSWSNHENS